MVVQVTLSDGEAAIIRGAATRAHVTIEEFLRGATLLYIEVAKHPYFQEGPDQPTPMDTRMERRWPPRAG
jgi:hypothetical protein